MPPEPESADRLKAALESLFALMLPRLAYMMQWEGRVILAAPPAPTPAFISALFQGPATYVTPGFVNVQLTDPDALAIFGPKFSTIPIALWGDASGFVCVPTVGSLVRVGFVNGSPVRPFIAGTDPTVFPTLSAGVILRALALTGLPTPNPAFSTALGAVG